MMLTSRVVSQAEIDADLVRRFMHIHEGAENETADRIADRLIELIAQWQRHWNTYEGRRPLRSYGR